MSQRWEWRQEQADLVAKVKLKEICKERACGEDAVSASIGAENMGRYQGRQELYPFIIASYQAILHNLS